MQSSFRTWPSRFLARPWLLAFVPVNAATSGFGVALPLLILISLHGSWVDVALSAALYNIAVIVASMVWGYLSDRYTSRRRFLLFTYAAFALLYVALTQVTSLPLLYGIYILIGLIAPAGASASNLLILEKFTSEERANAYASFQEMSIVGGMAGVLGGYFWLLAARPLGPLLYILAALSAMSAAAVWVGIRPPERRVRTFQVARHPESLASRLRPGTMQAGFPFFPVRPAFTRVGWTRLRRWIREEAHHELPLILAASFLFNLSSNLFNITYVPYLYAIGIGAASIFLVNFANNFTQGLAFPISGNLTARLGADRLVQRSTYVRSLGYLAVAGFTFLPFTVAGGFSANAIAFAVLGGAIAFYSTGSSMVLFRALEGRDAGSLLGVNSALGGVAAVAGAVLSGAMSFVGFRITFLVAAGTLLASLPLWAAAHIAYTRRKSGRPAVVLRSSGAGASGPPPPTGPPNARGPTVSVDPGAPSPRGGPRSPDKL
ncbi:MAG: MFS transporter [Thermoplasmata archaeon]